MSEHEPRYDFEREAAPDPPISMAEFARLRDAVVFTAEDERRLRQVGEILEPQLDDVLDLWCGDGERREHLLYYCSVPDGELTEADVERIRDRFGRWILDACEPPYDEEWLATQFEFGRRHCPAAGEGSDAAAHAHLRYLITFVYPLTAAVRGFLEDSDYGEREVDAMHRAWFKAVVLQVALWSYPYAEEDAW